jgi:methylated-DNA-[protein]-cysteine S-methyltransferase
LARVDLPNTRGAPPSAVPAAPAMKPAVAAAVSSAGTQVGSEERSDQELADRWAEQLAQYFRGDRLRWTADELGLDGLAVGLFARLVYATLLTVPPGVTVSYGDLAAMAGHPRAARAVGSAMANNPVPIVIPCHRVIRSDGSLGRYGDDPAWKPYLLEHEERHAQGTGGVG